MRPPGASPALAVELPRSFEERITVETLELLRAEYRDAQKREMLIGMILENKVLDIIESKAKIT